MDAPPVVKIVVDDVSKFKSIIEILNSIVTEVATVEFIRDKSILGQTNPAVTSVNNNDLQNDDAQPETPKKKKHAKKTHAKKKHDESDALISNTNELNVDDNCSSEQTKTKKRHKKKITETEHSSDCEQQPPKNNGLMRIITKDSNLNLISCIELNAADFREFEVLPAKHVMGLNVPVLYKSLKNVDKNGLMTIVINPDDLQTITISIKSLRSRKTSQSDIKILNVADTNRKLIEVNYSIVVTISSVEFHRTCKDLFQFSPHVEITCDSTCFAVACACGMSTQKRIFERDDDIDGNIVNINVVNDNSESPTIIRSVFELRHINLMYKCTALSPLMEIYLKPCGVMFLRYVICKESNMLVGIVPTNNSKEQTIAEMSTLYDEPSIELM